MSAVIGRQKIWTIVPLLDVLFSLNMSRWLFHSGFATEDIMSIKIMNRSWWGVGLDTVERVGRVDDEQRLHTPLHPRHFLCVSLNASFLFLQLPCFCTVAPLHGNRKLRDRRMSVAYRHNYLLTDAAHSITESQLHNSVIKHTCICNSQQYLEYRHKTSWEWKFFPGVW